MAFAVLGAAGLLAGGAPAPSGASRTLEVQQSRGERTFLQLCAPCHGPEGRGDGPAAVAFNPRPADYTKPEGVGDMTDEELRSVIAKGKGGMPAWGPVLSQEVIEEVAAYIRTLSKGSGG